MKTRFNSNPAHGGQCRSDAPSQLRALLLAALALAMFVGQLHAATITWTNTSGGSWSVAANWNPNQVPTNADTALITTPGTYAVVLDFTTAANQSLYPAITVGAGGGAAGVQTLAMTNKQFFFTYLLVTTGGAFAANGCYIGSPGETMTVNGGVLNSAGRSFGNTMVVINGAVANSTNSGYTIVTVASGGVFNANGSGVRAMTVAVSGTANVTGPFSLEGPLTNSGTLNISNSAIVVYIVIPPLKTVAGRETAKEKNAVNGGLVNFSGRALAGFVPAKPSEPP